MNNFDKSHKICPEIRKLHTKEHIYLTPLHEVKYKQNDSVVSEVRVAANSGEMERDNK